MSNSIIILRISLAILLGTIIGVEREIKNRPAGMRTHILVCLGACIISLIESSFVASLSASTESSVAYNFGRLSAQVISGIGFLGAGTILFTDRKITGLTTAASLWNTACLGIAIGYGYYLIAIVGSIFDHDAANHPRAHFEEGRNQICSSRGNDRIHQQVF